MGTKGRGVGDGTLGELRQRTANPMRSSQHEAKPDDRATQRLEVRFRWHGIHQYWPVSLQSARELWKARTALSELVMKNRGIRFDEVRSEGKLLLSLLRGWRLLQTLATIESLFL
jgi:hypothetical protein